MNEDRIKAIAEDKAHDYAKMCSVDVEGYESIRLAYLAGAEEALNVLSTRYCIVEREKVVELYENASFVGNESITNTLNYLFGTSMFNQNESENETNN